MASKRVVAAKTAVGIILAELPENGRSYNQVAKTIGLNTSAHLTWLVRDSYMSPTLETRLIIMEFLEPPPDPFPTAPCEICGEVHKLDWCTHYYGSPTKPGTTLEQRTKRKRRPRFSVAADDPMLAFRQLEKYYPGLFNLESKNNEDKSNTRTICDL